MTFASPPDNLPVLDDDATPMERSSARAERLLDAATRLTAIPAPDEATLARFADLARREFGDDAAAPRALRSLLEESLRFVVTVLQIASARRARGAALCRDPKPQI